MTQTKEEFLLARIDDLETRIKIYYGETGLDELRPLLESQRYIVKLHKKWPTLVESAPEFSTITGDGDKLYMQMTQQYAWATQEEYRKRFGIEAPTAPMIRVMLEGYRFHKDFDPAWAE